MQRRVIIAKPYTADPGGEPAYRGAPNRARGGLTLIELLIVITVMLAVTALTIPVMAPALKGRRVREATRMVDVYVNGARNRATLIGRPVGVVFDRVPGLPEACATLAYAEVPPPYAGDFQNSRIVVYVDSSVTPPVVHVPGFTTNDSGWLGLLRRGDLLQLNYQGHRWALDGTVDANGYLTGTYTYNSMTGTFTSELDWVLRVPQGNPLPSTPPGGLAFQIVRQPVRSSGDSLQLPPGIVVDLSWSGFSMEQLDSSGSPFDTWRFAPNPVGDPTSVVVMFNPTGSVSGVFCWANLPFNGTPAPTWGPQAPLAPLHFLVGRRENVPFNAEAMGPDSAWGVLGVDDDGDGGTDNNIWESGWPGSDDRVPGFNLQDLTSLWVSINPQTGLITSAENAAMPYTTGLTPLQRMRFARDIALESQAMGGR